MCNIEDVLTFYLNMLSCYTHTCACVDLPVRMLSIDDHHKRKLKKAECIAPAAKKSKIEPEVQYLCLNNGNGSSN